MTTINELKEQQANLWKQYETVTRDAERFMNELGYGTVKEVKEHAKTWGVAYKSKSTAIVAIGDAYLAQHGADGIFEQYEELGIQIMEMEEQAIEPVIEEQVETPDFTAVSTDALISESKSLTETRLMQINGHISLTAEQIADVDARGHAVAAELAKRFAEEEYHDPQYPRIEKSEPAQEADPVVENEQEVQVATPEPTPEQVRHNLTHFFEVLAQYINEHVLEPDDMVVRGECGHRYIAKFLGYDDLMQKRITACPECAEFETLCEAEYQEYQEKQAMQSVDIPIGDEYCWAHNPGGWCCPQCYYDALIAAMHQAVQEVPSYCEVQAAQFAGELLVTCQDCPECGFTLCPACEQCHSLHCKDGKMMGVECGEAMDALASVQRSEGVLV